MKKKWNKVTAALLMLVMVVTTVLGAAPALSVKAEPVTMGHLKSGSGNANGHFGSATPEAFVLSEKADYTNQAYSLKLRINSDVDKTRLRIVTKYKDDNNWAFLMYDVGSWKWQYKKDGNEAWQNDTLALPRLEKGQLAEIKLSYKDNGLEIDVNGTKATVTEANFVALKDVQGKVGGIFSVFIRFSRQISCRYNRAFQRFSTLICYTSRNSICNRFFLTCIMNILQKNI